MRDLKDQSSDVRNAFLLQSITDHAIYVLDPDGQVLSWNVGAERIKGHRAEEIIGRHFSALYTEEDRAIDIPQQNLAVAQSQGRCETQGWRLRADGTRIWASVVIHAIYVAGTLAGFAKVATDCTEQKLRTEAVEAMAKNMELALSFLPYGACLLDRSGEVLLSNPAFVELFPEAVLGTRLLDAIKTHVTSGALPSCGTDKLTWSALEARHTVCDIEAGDRIIAARARAAQGQGWVVTFEDVTARRRAERDVSHKAHHDVLTGLANRDGLDVCLKAGIESCAATGGCAVLYLDLDRFKVVNDTCGHHAGDMVLKEAAERILNVLRSNDFSCRLGGDEFIVVPEWPITADHALRVAERLREQFEEPFTFGPRQIHIGVSIGIAVSSPGDRNTIDLIGHADLALYKAKREGRGCITLFDRDLGVAMLRRQAMELQISTALAANEFSLAYQPICAVGGQAVRGFEALLRWTRADGIVVPPSEFVALAEEVGAMAEIGGWVLETACQEAAGWPPNFTVAVNVSATQIQDPKLLERIVAALEKAKLDPRRLEIEITETAVILDHAHTLSVLTQIRRLGVGIAIDDFGIGYSSLSFLRTLPFTRVKIDRSFVSDIADNPNSVAIVRALIRMSYDLGLAVTAEGVETEEQHSILTDEACQDMQGYLFAKPMRAENIPQFLADHSDRVGSFV